MPSSPFFKRSITIYVIVSFFTSSLFSSIVTMSFADASSAPDTQEITAGSPQQPTVEGEILIKYRDGSLNLRTVSGLEASAQLMEEQNILQKEDIDMANISIASVGDDDVTVEEKIKELEKDPRIEYAQPNYQYLPADLGINDAYTSNLWSLYNPNDADIDASEAWAIGEGSGAIVAVIDTGVAYMHPDLANSMWDGTQCRSYTNAPLGGCQHGYDFESYDTMPLPTSSTHGTHVAGIISAQKNNTIGIAGVAPQSKIMAIKSSLTTDNIIKSIHFAQYNGAKIINASWGDSNPVFATDQALIEAIRDFPGIFVTAAGNDHVDNDTTPFYPANYDLSNIISVAATDHNDALTSFSNYGNTSVDIGAPGLAIWSTITGDGYGSMSGTSMAAPHVAGLAALLWASKPTLSVADIKDIILTTGDTTMTPSNATSTGKRINAHKALQSINPDKSITSFILDNPSITGIIDEVNHTIRLSVPAMPITALSPIITTTGTSVSPASGSIQDFTNPVTYTVTAADGTTQSYIVTVSQVLDVSILTETITAEIGADHTMPAYTLSSAEYTAESWLAYTNAVDWGRTLEIDAGATIEQIVNSIIAIGTAKSGLIFAGLADLENAKENIADFIQADYTSESWTTLTETFTLPEATNAQIVDKTIAINGAISGLIFAGLADLEDAKKMSNDLQEDIYTTASWQTFVIARNNALALPETTNALVVAKRQALNEALLGLITIVDNAALDVSKIQADSLIQEDYTVDSWAILTEALTLPESTNTLVIAKKGAIDSALSSLILSVSLDNTNPEVVIAYPTSITIQAGTTNPVLDVSNLISAGTGILPHITITANNAHSALITIPEATTVTTTDTSWNGHISTPTVTTDIILPTTSSENKTLSTAIRVGYTGAKLSFNKGVRILLLGQANKRVGYSHTGSDFTEITSLCSADTQTAGDTLSVDGDCQMTVGEDLVIWTRHFTTFATFSATAIITSGGGGGGGGGGGSSGGSASVNNNHEASPISTVVSDKIVKLNTAPSEPKKELQNIPEKTTLDAFIEKTLSEKKRTGVATRLETTLLSLNVAGVPIESKYICKKIHSDTYGKKVPSFTCQVAEKAREKKIISQTNKQFNPLMPVSRIEAYSIMMKSICVHPITNGNNWKQEVIKKAMELGFTVRNLDTFEPDRALLIPEMYSVVQRLNNYSKDHNTCQ